MTILERNNYTLIYTYKALETLLVYQAIPGKFTQLPIRQSARSAPSSCDLLQLQNWSPLS